MAEQRALFLDRDGVINVEYGYVHSPRDFSFQDGIFDLCRAAQALGYLLVVITNQAGIARGYYTETDFLRLTDWMNRRFAEEGIRIASVYYCPFHPIHGIGNYKRDSEDRKPKPGMLLRAQKELDLDMRSSILIGDKLSDIEAAKAAHVGTRILLDLGGVENPTRQDDYLIARSLSDVESKFLLAPSNSQSAHLPDCRKTL